MVHSPKLDAESTSLAYLSDDEDNSYLTRSEKTYDQLEAENQADKISYLKALLESNNFLENLALPPTNTSSTIDSSASLFPAVDDVFSSDFTTTTLANATAGTSATTTGTTAAAATTTTTSSGKTATTTTASGDDTEDTPATKGSALDDITTVKLNHEQSTLKVALNASEGEENSAGATATSRGDGDDNAVEKHDAKCKSLEKGDGHEQEAKAEEETVLKATESDDREPATEEGSATENEAEKKSEVDDTEDDAPQPTPSDESEDTTDVTAAASTTSASSDAAESDGSPVTSATVNLTEIPSPDSETTVLSTTPSADETTEHSSSGKEKDEDRPAYQAETRISTAEPAPSTSSPAADPSPASSASLNETPSPALPAAATTARNSRPKARPGKRARETGNNIVPGTKRAKIVNPGDPFIQYVSPTTVARDPSSNLEPHSESSTNDALKAPTKRRQCASSGCKHPGGATCIRSFCLSHCHSVATKQQTVKLPGSESEDDRRPCDMHDGKTPKARVRNRNRQSSRPQAAESEQSFVPSPLAPPSAPSSSMTNIGHDANGFFLPSPVPQLSQDAYAHTVPSTSAHHTDDFHPNTTFDFQHSAPLQNTHHHSQSIQHLNDFDLADTHVPQAGGSSMHASSASSSNSPGFWTQTSYASSSHSSFTSPSLHRQQTITTTSGLQNNSFVDDVPAQNYDGYQFGIPTAPANEVSWGMSSTFPDSYQAASGFEPQPFSSYDPAAVYQPHTPVAGPSHQYLGISGASSAQPPSNNTPYNFGGNATYPSIQYTSPAPPMQYPYGYPTSTQPFTTHNHQMMNGAANPADYDLYTPYYDPQDPSYSAHQDQ